MIKKLTILCLFALGQSVALAEYEAYKAGKAVGEFGAGAGEVMGARISNAIWDSQPQWVTVEPRSRKECLAASGGELNNTFVRCRNGWQEYVRFDAKGNKIVLSERSIPSR